MKKYLFLILGMLWQPVGLTATTVELDPTHIRINDTFHLILTSDNADSRALPNLAPLQQDFTILGTERNISYSMVNGQTASFSQWIILLRPKKEGNLIIPAITIGREHTKPNVIDVGNGQHEDTSSTDNAKVASDDVMLKTTTSEPKPYVNQQVLYTVKLYSNQRLINPEYHAPIVEDALLIPLGDGRHYQTQIDNQLYSVEEQQYAIFPQKSGKLTVIAPTLDAEIYSGFPRHVTAKTTPTVLSIRPTPPDYKARNWLPAKNITLTETYDPPKQVIKQGDTITRTVTLSATAMPAQLLPILSFKTNKEFNVYPESPELKNSVQSNELMGTSTLKVTYLLNQSGNITIPELKLPWFNTITGKTEISSLPAHTLTIEPNGLDPANERNTQLPTTHSSSVQQTAPSPSSVIQWAFVAGFGLACGLIASLWWFQRTKRPGRNRSNQIAIKRLQSACQKNRPALARTSLLNWAKTQWPEAGILNLQDIATHTRDAQLKKQLQLLTQALYRSNQQPSWQGGPLWQSFNAYRQTRPERHPHHNRKRTDLPPINPS